MGNTELSLLDLFEQGNGLIKIICNYKQLLLRSQAFQKAELPSSPIGDVGLFYLCLFFLCSFSWIC